MNSRRPAWLLQLLLVLAAVLLLGAGIVALVSSTSVRPGPFYAIPAHLPKGPPGTLIREEPIHSIYPGTEAYRILYKSTGSNGRPTAVSGLVVFPEGTPPRRGRKVIAFAHSTVGVATNCAPSLQRGGYAQIIQGLGEFIAEGYVVAVSDYAGLGTREPHAYLDGPVEAMNVLDSVRAAHRLSVAHAGVEFALWGVSQGGQAALFAAQIAPTYAPRLHLVGVAAGAPVTSLVDLFDDNLESPPGKVLLSMALSSWEQVYVGAGMDQVVTEAVRPSVEAIARRCLYGPQYTAAAPPETLAGVSFIGSPPWGAEPWRSILAHDTLSAAPIPTPVLLLQGAADKIVPAALTVRLARGLCAAGNAVELRIYPTVEDGEVGIVAAPDVAAWVAGRFAGYPPPSTCA